MKYKYLIGLVICGIILGIAFTNLFLIFKDQQAKNNLVEKETSIISNSSVANSPVFTFFIIKDTDCKNLSLDDSAYCLKEKLSTFYKYNISESGKYYSEAKLHDVGGVCSQFARWYVDKMTKLGYESRTVYIKTGDDSAHEFAVSSDKTGYCVLDQLSIECERLLN